MASDVTQVPASAAGPAAKKQKNYKGFVAGVFSGIAKLSGASSTPCLRSTNTS
jgi:hypothetical protein